MNATEDGIAVGGGPAYGRRCTIRWLVRLPREHVGVA
jgi:hypothetical protein